MIIRIVKILSLFKLLNYSIIQTNRLVIALFIQWEDEVYQYYVRSSLHCYYSTLTSIS